MWAKVQSLFTFANLPPTTIFGASGSGVFFGDPPPTVANPQINPLTRQIEPIAQNGGTMQVRIAGSVINSIFSASVDRDPDWTLTGNGFGNSGRLILPRGVINAKVEGNIGNSNNSLVDPAARPGRSSPRSVHLAHGPVIPPDVPYQPYRVADGLSQRSGRP